jgi:hypothetical protein
MNIQQKLDFIEKYLSDYFDRFVLKDIEMIRKNKLEFTIPYVLLVSTGIDFLGGINQGFYIIRNGHKYGNSSVRFIDFVKEWFGRINSNYRIHGIPEIIYNSARCGVAHQSIYKREVESMYDLYPRDKHLNHMVDIHGQDRIFIHPLQLVDDFISAQDLFRKEYIKQNINDVYMHLDDMLNESDKNFPRLVNNLKTKGLTFRAEDIISHSPKVRTYNKNTKKIIGTDGEEVRPSAPPPGSK